MVSRKRAAVVAGRCEHSVLSDGHRVASERKGAARRGAARRVEDDPARPRHRERDLCGGGEPRGLRGATREGHRVLGIVVRGRSVRAGDRGSVARSRRNIGSGMRPGAHGGSAAQLALSARPPHRGLRTDSQPMARRLRRSSTPRALGFRMPAEWERHEATWLAWPHEKSDWPGKFEPIPWVYGDIVRHLARVERVRILVEDADAEEKAKRVLSKSHAKLSSIEFFRVPTNRSWARDFCPLFIKDKA